jgi:hypothetical protein
MKFWRRSRVDAHIKVAPESRDRFRYREDDHETYVTAELMSDEPRRVIYASSIGPWLPPYDGEVISDSRRAEIAAKMGRYFELNGESFRIQ